MATVQGMVDWASALNNHLEFFTEPSEACLVRHDFFPLPVKNFINTIPRDMR
jgi:hypothetical protein